ncbi:MAG: tetratricopeptide (TPR) repeat protein [Flavobacteriales bacterium]|jgi:tetratricopeptide (TPR) repeat protein|tara:strand:- start:120 stop:584 length:465 start_codon:yes stop_codon:yes gene_type:complete
MKSSFLKIFSIILAGALIILVSLQFLSRKPSINQDEVDIKKASQMIQNGQPMKGVMLLRGILEKDENNIDAIWELGKLSMQSQQYEKAIGRFEKFVSLTGGEDKVSGLIYLSDAYFLNSERQKSLDNLIKAKALNKKSDLVIDIEERINIINKN